jgi:nucleotide-binding universal stress UspA family protein
MPFNVILATISNKSNDSAVLDEALGLAQQYGSHIRVLYREPELLDLIPQFQGMATPRALVKQVNAAKRELERTSRQTRSMFETWRKKNRLEIVAAPQNDRVPTVSWHEAALGDPVQLTRWGRLADVVVIERPEESPDDAGKGAIQTALFHTGRPILLTPPEAKSFAFGPVLIAWNGSAEASRAVASALPLLHRSSDVAVLTAPEDGIFSDAAHGLVDYLAWHGIKARALTATRKAKAEDCLMAAANNMGAELLVMGAYTHSRVRELVFGGVTRHVLFHAKIPVLMAH